MHSAQSGRSGQPGFLGLVPGGFGLFASLLLAVASAFFTFFAATCLAIFSLLLWNGLGGHSVNYADSYRYVGFPAGAVVLVVALPLALLLWFRGKLRR